MAKKRKTLPKDFEALLQNSSVEELIKLFDTTELDAKGGYSKQTALAFNDCPHELAKWLVENGLDIESQDDYKRTPLQERSMRYSGNIKSLIELGANVNFDNGKGSPLQCAVQNHIVENVKILLESGANVDSQSTYGYGQDNVYTPLEVNLFSCNNIDIENTLEISKILLAAGAKKTERMKTFVTEIGKSFEFHRPRFNDESVNETSDALNELYKLFEVEPVPMRVVYDGKSPIPVTAKTWQKQHEELWELLVPSSGQASTVQGEVIRLTGKISRELLDNGAINWDSDYKKMTDAFADYVQNGNPLNASELEETKKLVTEIKAITFEKARIYRMVELGVNWVVANLDPIALGNVGYDR